MPKSPTPDIQESSLALEINDHPSSRVLANVKFLNKITDNPKSIASNKSIINAALSNHSFEQKQTSRHSDHSDHDGSEKHIKFNIEIKPCSIGNVPKPLQ